MDPAWSALVFLLVAAALGWFWHDGLATRESANRAAQEACQQLGLQFLDGTVVFVRMALIRGHTGYLTLRRTYVFDYTANSIERRQGFIVLAAQRLESIGFAPGDEARAAPQPVAVESSTPTAASAPTTPSSTSPVNSAKVFSIEDWRRHRQRRPPAPRADDVDDARR
jgi:hypothetical protein